MKKIAIVTLYDDINIGNKLQNYAVQTFFEDLGFSCTTIPHWEMAHDTPALSRIKRFIVKVIGLPANRARELRLMTERKKKFKLFSNQYLHLGNCIRIKSIPRDFNKKFDFFVVGSDQVWHNWTQTEEEVNYFFLTFAERSQRVTISPSFGKEQVEEQFLNVYKKGLNGFEFLTCREEQGAKIIEELTEKKAQVLLDPTMLIKENNWVSIEKKPGYMIPTNYLLVYALGKKNEYIHERIKYLSGKYSLSILDITDVMNKELYLTTPDEFLYLIHNAKLVVTDSFHASVFSILYRTNFLVFDRELADMGNMSSRLNTLLSKFKLENRKVDHCDENCIFDTDFSHVENVLNVERSAAIKLYNTIK